MADDGFFQINDIVLDIPPEQISVSRDSVNHIWQTLRTRSSIKAKSGFSTINIRLNAKFTDTYKPDEEGLFVNGLEKLRDLISQFRVTPFCYVENAFLRNSILGGAHRPNMALALKQIQIIKAASPSQGINVVDVYMTFTWFNYTPFLQDFTFKKDIFGAEEVRNPKESKAWKLLYKAEQERVLYLNPSKLDGKTQFSFTQFAQLQVKKYETLQKELQALRSVRENFLNRERSLSGKDSNVSITENLYRGLAEQLGSNQHAKALQEELFGSTTSMLAEEDTRGKDNLLQEVMGVLNSVGKDTSRFSLADVNVWEPVYTTAGKAIRLKNEPLATFKREDEYSPEENILLRRKRNLRLEDAGLIVTAISISFENVLAAMPLIGHQYPTFQHIGSVDAVVTMSILTTSEQSIQALSNFYSIIEDQAFKYRNIPQGQRNITIHNEMLAMCGLYEFMPNSLMIETIPGQPGTYSATLELIDNPIQASTKEKINPGQSFTNTNDLRVKIAEILSKNIRIVNTKKLVPEKPGPFDIGALNLNPIQLEGRPRVSDATGNKIPISNRYYIYSGQRSQRNEAFENLCDEYAQQLGVLFERLSGLFLRVAEREPVGPIAEFFSLDNADIHSIEKIQSDLVKIFKQTGRVQGTFKNKFGDNLDKIRKSADRIIADSDEDQLRRRQQAREARIKGGVSERTVTALEEAHIGWLGRVSDFMNDHLAEWDQFSNRFIDTIINAGFIDLPQFASVANSIKEASVLSSGDSYPDFPLEQIVSLLQDSDDPATQRVFEELKQIAFSDRLGFKNLGVSSLINPDFYFYNRQNDAVGRIIPQHVMNAAIDSIKVSQDDKRVAAEVNWFQEVYDEKILGREKAERVKNSIASLNQDGNFWNKHTTKEARKAVQQAIEAQLQGVVAFHYDDLQDDSTTNDLGCSILESQENTDSPVILEKIDDLLDSQNFIARRRGSSALIPNPAHHGQARHRFGTKAIDFLQEQAYRPPTPSDPNKTPVFNWPTDPSTRVITSSFGPRNIKVPGASTNHRGIDISKYGNSKGQPIYAAADGEIILYSYSSTEKSPGKRYGHEGVRCVIKHDGGWVTKYFHMDWDDTVKDLSKQLWDTSSGQPIFKPIKVKQNTRIGTIGNTGTIKPHLHFETWLNNKPVDPRTVLSGGFQKSQGPLPDIDPNNESLLTRSIDQLEKELKTGQGYSMVRAYPTFRLYFIESDIGERKRFGFDDFFSYSSVKEIQLVRSRKIASDLCVLTLTNVSGVLSNRKFRNAIDGDKPRDSSGNIIQERARSAQRTNTAQENPVASLMLQPGIQIQLRLGYNANPEELETVFNGVISEVKFNDSDELVTIVCQSFAIELVQNIHGTAKSWGGFLSSTGRTARILEELLAFPEVVHFGRWEGGSANNSFRSVLTTRWKLVPSPQDDNIFAPTGRGLRGLFDSTEKYTMYQTTIWDVFQEMTLRHPAYVACAVPYQGKYGPRMTMFFGLPDQMYFARDPSFEEDRTVSGLRRAVKEATKNLKTNRSGIEELSDPNKVPDPKRLTEKELSKAREEWIENQIRTLSIDNGVVKPFRNYHVVTSTQHIIKNSIENASYNTFNTVTLQYGDEEAEEEESTQSLQFGDLKTFTLKADAAIDDEDSREFFAQYPNCVGYEMAKRYCVSLLFWALKDGYRGDLVIMGNEKIKPYDIMYVFDEYTDMFGPIEVEQVVHRLSQETGFVSEITPDMIVHVNQLATLSTSDAMGLMAEHALKSIGLQSLPSLLSNAGTGAVAGAGISLAAGAPLAAVTALGVSGALLSDLAFSPIANMIFNSSEHTLSQGASTSPFGLVGAFIFRKLITRTQLAHPFRFSPLVKNSRAMVGGLPNRKTDGSFLQGIKTWAKEADDGFPLWFEDTYDRLHPNNWFGHSQGSIQDAILGQER